MRILSVLGLLILLLGQPVAGAELECQGDETLQEAFLVRVNQGLDAARESPVAERLVAEREEALEADLAAESTSGTAPGSASSLRDLLSFLVASVDLGGLSEDGKSLVFDLNPDKLRGKPGDLGIRAIIHDPEPFEPLLTAVEEAGDAELLSTLQDSTEELDDLELSVIWERKSKLFGREIDRNAGGTGSLVHLLGELHAEAIEEITSSGGEDMEELLQVLASFVPEGVTAMTTCSAAPAEVRQAVAKAADEAAAELLKVRATLKGVQFYHLADLLNNQRQLYVTGAYRKRAPAVGRDEASVEAKYEHSFASLWGARNRSYDEKKGWDFAELKTYVEQENGMLKYAPRLTFSASYTWLDEYAPPDIASAIDLSLDEAERLSVAASFGMYLRLAETADGARVGNTRFDLEARYDDYSDDAAKRDRAVVTATLVQPLVEKLSATVGVVWVNKPEFLEQFLDEDDDELSARVGFKFTLDKGDG